MIKILSYSLSDKTSTYSRRLDDKKESQRIEAESELSMMVDEGWTIISTSSYHVNNVAFASTIGSRTHLVVVLQK